LRVDRSVSGAFQKDSPGAQKRNRWPGGRQSCALPSRRAPCRFWGHR
jgi:hypothetical protein